MSSDPTVMTFAVLRAQAGDREAFDEILQTIQHPLYRYLRNVTGVDEAEDLLQETLLQVYRKLHWLRDPELLIPWAFRIASRVAFRRLRRRRRLSESQLDTDLALEAPLVHDPSAVSMIEGRLSQVSPASRAVLTLHYLEELTLQEIAEILELPTGTVKSRLAYGLRQLRIAMEAS